MDIPVYLIAGFLDAGKTSFINGVLRDGFAEEDRTLLICCEEGELEYEHLCWDPVIFLVQSAHPCCRYARYRDTFYHPWIDLREFEQEIFILQHQGQSLRQYSDQLLEEAGLSPQRITRIRNIETAAQMAANGLGVSFCLESYFRHTAALPLLCGRTPAGG